MTAQDSLFAEDILDALGDVVRAMGGAKTVGPMMRHNAEMPPLQAAKWLLDCLNKERRERFTPDQVLWLLREGRRVGCHSAINFLCDDAGYSRPNPIEPEDEAAALMRDYIESVKLQKRLADRMERLHGIKAVAA